MTDDLATDPDAPPSRGVTARLVLIPLAFVLAYLGARAGIERVDPGSRAALGFALLPLPFLALMLVGYVRGVRSMDELERRIQLEALALAFPIALFVVFTAGVLDLAGFHGDGDWDLPRLFPILLVPYWFGLWRARRKYA